MLDVDNADALATVAAEREPPEPIVILRGTARGLELVLDGGAPVDDLVVELEERLVQSPSFFAGNATTVRVLRQPLPAGALGRFEAVAERYALHIAEVRLERGDAARLAAGSGPLAAPPDVPVAAPASRAPAPVAVDPGPVGAAESLRELERAATATPMLAAPLDLDAIAVDDPTAARFVLGPIRSGVILETPGHLVIIGDVNPGAEVRAGRSIAVLGSLRGVAHAGIMDDGWILAIRLDPQQLRIGALLARSGEPAAARGPEIAFVADGQITAQAYNGKLPRGTAAKR